MGYTKLLVPCLTQLIKLFLLIITPVFASPQHLVNSTHWDNSVWTEYGQSFEATAPSMHGVSFYMANINSAPGPFEIAVYALPDTDTPIKLHEFSADGSGLDGLVEVVFDSHVVTTVGSNYLFTIKRGTPYEISSSEAINSRWEKQTFTNGDIVMIDHDNNYMWPFDMTFGDITATVV